uniref:Si:dkey-87o1.2 n=1 Tax=Cyprinus carpio carpio TaxID=630221 RepID=A0A9J8BB89_CYPCA
MRAISAVLFLALCALLVIIYQAVQQELHIRSLKTRIAVSDNQVKLKEDGILGAKTKLEEMNKSLNPLITQRDQLKKQKDDIKTGNANSEKELGTCQAEKGKLEKQSTETKDSLQKLKGKYELLLLLGFDWNEDVWILMLNAVIFVSCCCAENQEAEGKKAEEEIEGLKQQILQRDLKICKFVDTALDEAK